MQPLKYITFLKIWQPIGQQGQMKKLILLPPQQGKNQKENGPGSESDKLAGCTYIELAGIYKYDPSHTDGVKVKYTFYLGGNTNDYNIARDYSYDITFRIAGPNSADVRVEITDGNVAIFNEVDVIKNIIVDF